MLRRSVMLVLVLNLAALVPVPLSACAILSGMQVPCQCPMAMPCGPGVKTMNQNGDPVISCHCIGSGSPIPQGLENATAPEPQMIATNRVFHARAGFVWTSRAFAAEAGNSEVGPPTLQAQLCVFLI